MWGQYPPRAGFGGYAHALMLQQMGTSHPPLGKVGGRWGPPAALTAARPRDYTSPS